MVTADDVADLVKARLEATSGYATALPGKGWWDRGPDEPSYAYEVHTIEGGEKELFSGAAYLQPWTLSFAAYCPIGETGVNPQAVEQLLNSAFGTDAANTALQAVALRNATEKVLHCLPRVDSASFASTLRDGRDVFVIGAVYELLIQGDKSVS